MENKNTKSKKKNTKDVEIDKTIKVILAVTSIILILGGPIISLLNAGKHTIKINAKYNKIENEEIKRMLENEFEISGDTYIRKITYKTGLDDGKIWTICVSYGAIQGKCKNTGAPFDYFLPRENKY